MLGHPQPAVIPDALLAKKAGVMTSTPVGLEATTTPRRPTNPFNPSPLATPVLDGILPNKGGVEKEAELPDFIPDDVIVPISSAQDVDNLPRGALAHLTHWDEDLAYDLIVAGAGLTFLDRATKESLEAHDDFDAEGFGIIDEQGLWLPGLDVPYEREEGGWRRAPASEEE